MAKVTHESMISREWHSKNGKWTVRIWNDDISLIFVSDGYLSDWPTVYDDGRIVYDSPGFVPKYVRKIVADMVHVIKTKSD